MLNMTNWLPYFTYQTQQVGTFRDDYDKSGFSLWVVSLVHTLPFMYQKC